ncbi:class IV adenylate cyclase [Halobacteriales archaeon QS_1_68_20]|nr:MAG: class IV adenylate cyclase [Halobacteriales archaeon QS_1_68_20]
MYEVEVKVPADHEAVRRRLRELDAERLETVRQADTYYDAPHRNFVATDEALRVREETRTGAGTGTGAEKGTGAENEGGETVGAAAEETTVHRLTYKGPKVDEASKTRAEHETDVGDPDAMDSALQALGFDPVADVRKERERYALDGYTVTLDEVDGLGQFVEVERDVPEAEIEATRDGALALLDDLGLDPDASVRTSYLGLMLGDEE